jgi:hypothetical protein
MDDEGRRIRVQGCCGLTLALLTAALMAGGCGDSDNGRRAVDSGLAGSHGSCQECHLDDGALKLLAQEPQETPEDSGEG